MSEKREQASPNGQWSKGTSGNPAGRPRGSRNKTTVTLEALLEGQAEQLIEKAVSMALNGDGAALRLCLERILPPRRERPIQLDLPALETEKDISKAMEVVTSAVADGQITPGEGNLMTNLLTARTKILRTEDLEDRLKRVERILSRDPATPHGEE